jgi:hypothetical protein
MSTPTQQQLIACAQNRRVVNTLLNRVRFYEHQGDALRARSYVAAANTVSRLSAPVRPGHATKLPGVGRAIGRAIEDACGDWNPAAADTSATPRIRTARGRPRKNRGLPTLSATELAEAEAWMRDPALDGAADDDNGGAVVAAGGRGGSNRPTMIDAGVAVAAMTTLTEGTGMEAKKEGSRHAAITESEFPEDGIDATAHRNEFALRTDAVVQLVDAQRLVTKLRRIAAGISGDVRIELVGAHRRHCLYGRRLHVLVTAAGTVSKDGDHDERHHVLMPKLVRAAQSVGLLGPKTRHVGSRALVARTNFDGSAAAGERYRREFLDAMMAKYPTTVDKTGDLFDTLPLALQDRITFPQPVFIEWSAHDRFFGRLACLTGPPSFTASLQASAAAACMRLTPDEGLVVGSLTSVAQGCAAPVACASEADVFRHLNRPYVDPELRGVGSADPLFDDVWR